MARIRPALIAAVMAVTQLPTACGSADDTARAPSVPSVLQPSSPSVSPTAQDAAPPARPEPAAPTDACHMQDGESLPGPTLRAVGTEPFWGARIEGRCVTYSHPEDQAGTRIWTRYVEDAGERRWTGALGGQSFELRLRSEPGCSDGMSDKRYPSAAELTVRGEMRRGCAGPESTGP